MLIGEPQKLPLQMAELQKVLEAKSKKDVESPSLSQPVMFEVSYKDCTLEGKFFLNYVSNLKLSIILKDEDLDKDKKFDLLKGYMEATNITEIYTLNDVVSAILLENKAEEVDVDLWLNKEERKEFTEQNKELIEKWERFMESILVGLPFCVEDYAKTTGKELVDSGALEVITDANAIGKNIGLLINTPGFLEAYLSYPVKHQPALYEAQWFEPVFSGHSLMNILQGGGSSLFPFMVAFMEGWFEEKELKEIAGAA